MTNREEEYRKETGIECKIEVSGEDCYVYTAGFKDWLIQKLDAETARADRAEKDRDELIHQIEGVLGFIIDGWSMPLGFSQIAGQARDAIKRIRGE